MLWCIFYTIMTYFLYMSRHYFEVKTYILMSWRTFLYHDILFISLFYVMTNVSDASNTMTYYLTSWRTLDVMTYLWCHDIILTSWHKFDIIKYFWHHDIFLTYFNGPLISWCNFDAMTYFLTSNCFDVMTYFLTSNSFTSWCTIWRHIYYRLNKQFWAMFEPTSTWPNFAFGQLFTWIGIYNDHIWLHIE